jgi:hypothetical protein
MAAAPKATSAVATNAPSPRHKRARSRPRAGCQPSHTSKDSQARTKGPLRKRGVAQLAKAGAIAKKWDQAKSPARS